MLVRHGFHEAQIEGLLKRNAFFEDAALRGNVIGGI
ncbi:hypothetical protein PA6566_01080 [Pseudomonas aeruginosa]|nr:hypothetical protein AM469_004380 [Pseudomonas aeruginosa]SAJ28391.1 Uncharacterised protein [Enterobacter cloacae]CAI9830300.1 hypothetical protein JCHGIK_31490 [Pseudomonas aeruginosa]CAI9859969.1 hypothetical protein PAE3796A_04860 [Pseudomonas aeruginosa]CAI9893354.1 hypothetical protein PAE3796A_04860 [Pseudomonas aeruginosa]